MTYEHKQSGPIWLIVLPAAVLLLALSWMNRQDHALAATFLAAGLLMFPLAASFDYLLVRDDGDHLTVHFGPIPLFRRHIPYAKITGVEAARSSFIDGWGIHYIPGRGWIWNLWGFDCVKIRLGSKVIRIGSDDADELVRFLAGKIAST